MQTAPLATMAASDPPPPTQLSLGEVLALLVERNITLSRRPGIHSTLKIEPAGALSKAEIRGMAHLQDCLHTLAYHRPLTPWLAKDLLRVLGGGDDPEAEIAFCRVAAAFKTENYVHGAVFRVAERPPVKKHYEKEGES